MDIHRCRFVPYRPQSINTLTFSHQSNLKQKSPQDLRLALGRENGDVEIWNPSAGRWVQEKILRGSRDRTVEQLAWTQDYIVDEDQKDQPLDEGSLRLFSSGGSPSITEWDLATGHEKRHADANSGEIWCFAAQPQWQPSEKSLELSKIAAAPSQLLAAGCSDGTVILFTTADDNLQYSRVLSPATGKKAKVISITWRDRSTVVAGYENGVIRVVDVPTRTVLRTMSLGKSFEGNVPLVWTLKCLPDGTILSGDSSGELKIWDSKSLSLLQKLKVHDADILDIASSVDGNTIFTAGVDRRLTVFKRISAHSNPKAERWQNVMHRRFHEHDVKALASFECKGMSVLVSGGMDTVPIVMPLRNWDTENHRSLSHLPHVPQMSCSAKARLMLTWWDRDLLIWQIPTRPVADPVNNDSLIESTRHLLARIELKGDENITSAQISADGTLIIAATITGVKLFQIRKRVEGEDVEIRTRPIDLPAGVRSFGASNVGFSPDSKWLIAVRPSNLIVLVKIIQGASNKEKPQIYHQIIKLSPRRSKSHPSNLSKLGGFLQSINCVSFSSDSRFLASGDLSGGMNTWVLEGHEDIQAGIENSSDSDSDSSSDSDSDSDDESDSRVIHGQKWIRNSPTTNLPQLNSAILALSFKPNQAASSVASEPALGLHPTRHNPHPVSHELPPQDTKLIAITASHQIIEFDVMSGKLSDWSRRNPSSYLPQSFSQIKDRVMGTFWDCDASSKRERLWLYGPTWLFMLDLACDLKLSDAQEKVGQIGDYDVREPIPSNAVTKRAAESPAALRFKKKQKRNTGAGDSKRAEEALTSVSAPNELDAMDIDTGLLSPDSENEDDNEDVEGENINPLAQLRRGTASAEQNDLNTDDSPEDKLDTPPPPAPSPAHHTIFRYRSIFGIAPLQQRHADTETDTEAEEKATKPEHGPELSSSSTNLEIVLVERPMYDVDLLPRFDGGQDWST